MPAKNLIYTVFTYRYAGLSCISLFGWVKGNNFEPRMSITSGPKNHNWNSININGDWQFLDCANATRYEVSKCLGTKTECLFMGDIKSFYYLIISISYNNVKTLFQA